MKNYELRLQLIQAKCQLILNKQGRHYHQELSKDLREIAEEAKKAYDEVANDKGWEAGDR